MKHSLKINFVYLACGILLLFSASQAWADYRSKCSAYKGQVYLNEVQIASSGLSSMSNHVELFNAGNVSASVWKNWRLKVAYRASSGSNNSRYYYYLNNNFSVNGQFIYNSNLALFLANMNGRYSDIALLDQNGAYIDYIAIENPIQNVPSCLSKTTVNATAASASQGDVARSPDGGSWPSAVNNGTLNTIGRTNVCNGTAVGSDLFVSLTADSTAQVIHPLVTVTPVTYALDVQNLSCSGAVSGISLNTANFTNANFSNLSFTPSAGTSFNSSNGLWTVNTLASLASANLTITGTPSKVGALTTTVAVATPAAGLVNTSDDSDSETINVRDFNYIGFETNTDEVTEGSESSYAAKISAMIKPSATVTVRYTVSGTAGSGDSNLSSSGSVVIDPSNPTTPLVTEIDFTLSNDSNYEPTKTIILTLTSISSADGAVKLDDNAKTMTITVYDDDTPSLLAWYHLDEASWTNTGEVNDASDNSFDGTATGSSGSAVPNWTTPAKNPGTCAYGNFSGGSSQQAVSIGTVNLGLGGQPGMSVIAWVRWSTNPAAGNANAMLLTSSSSASAGQFWLQHNADNSHFQFNVKTNAGIGSVSSVTSPVKDQWYHVVGVYDGSNLSIYVNGALEKSLAWTDNISAYSSYSVLIGRAAAAGSNNYQAFQGLIDEVKIYNGPILAANVADVYNETHSCPLYANGNLPNNFNCVEVGAAATGSLYTKLAASSFNLDVLALKNDGSIETGFVTNNTKTVNFELVDGADATSCASRTNLFNSLNQTISFTAANSGRKTVSIPATGNAYANVRCRITDSNQTPSVVACSSDNFAIRPSTLTLSGNTADVSGQSASASPVIKTGAGFALTASSDAAGYTGTPKLDASKVLAHTGAVHIGTLAGSFNAAINGVSTGRGFTYTEVGYFALAAAGVYDDSFTSVDSNGDCTADYSNSSVSGKYGCKFATSQPSDFFGRFIPDHLQAQLFSNGSFAHACGSFSYNGQTLNYLSGSHPMLNVYAYNASSPASITQNYTGAYARLQSSGVSLTAPTSDALQTGADKSNRLKLTALLSTPSFTDNGAGNLTLVLGNDSFTYQRENNALIAPFNNAIAIAVSSISDADAVTATGLPLNLQPAGEPIYYGRINLFNANGSEISDLPMNLQAEYFNGNGFIANTADQCSVTSLSISDADTRDSLAAAETCVWDNNALSGSYRCSTPAQAGMSFLEGSSLIAGNFNLNLHAPGKPGSLSVSAAVANWLKYNWSGSGATDPVGIASFGLYKGNNKILFFKEVY